MLNNITCSTHKILRIFSYSFSNRGSALDASSDSAGRNSLANSLSSFESLEYSQKAAIRWRCGGSADIYSKSV